MRMIAGLVVAILLCVVRLQEPARAEDTISHPALDRPQLPLKVHARSCREFEPDEEQLAKVMQLPGARTRMRWTPRLASKCLEIRTGEQRVVSFAVNTKSPMVASFQFHPAHHLFMFAALIVDRPVVLEGMDLKPGVYGLWLDGEGVPLVIPSKTIVIRGDAGDIGTIPVASGLEYPLPAPQFEPEGEDSVSLKLGVQVQISVRIVDR